jgi:phenylacetate-CoA ligase
MEREELKRAQAAGLAALLREVRGRNPFYGRKLEEAGFDPSRRWEDEAPEEILRSIPFTRKSELLEDQANYPRFGTNLTYPLARYVRFHQTSGTSGHPLIWLDTPESWDWVLRCWSEIYDAVGIGPTDRFFFPFSFGPFLGFWSAFEAACRRGNLCVPGGGMTTQARLQTIREAGITVVAVTPTYALRLAEVAREEGTDLRSTSVRALVVAGEPGGSIPTTKERIESSWNARCFDHCGMTEMGPFGYECPASPWGMHVLEEEFVVEVIEPRGADPVGEETPRNGGRADGAGRLGELVLTNLGRTASPVIRYRTGDLVRWSEAPCACGSRRGRLEGGIMGRVDDMVFVRGNNVYPAALEAILRKFPEIAEYRIRIRKRQEMVELTVEVEPAEGVGVEKASGGGPHLSRRISSAIEARLLFRADVVVVERGALPRFEMKARRWVKEY